jgi:signal transduction histidine kinase
MQRSLARDVIRTGQLLAVDHLSEDPRAFSTAEIPGWPVLGPAIIVPLRNSSGTEGVLALAWAPEHVADYLAVDAVLPASFAEQAALALQVAQAREDQERLAVFEDRDRIGRDLHDLVIQRLFAIGLSLQSTSRLTDKPAVAERLNTAVDDLDATIKDVRRSIFALGSLDDAADIQAEVSRMVDRAAGTMKFRPSLTFEGPIRTRISSTVAPDLLAVLGEALSNASRHANASAVDVVLRAGDDIVLVVADNGAGLPTTVNESGLRNMRQRAEQLGGRCLVTSTPATGTRVEWTVPAS